MPAEYGFNALDKKAGMKFTELQTAVAAVGKMSPGKQFVVKVTLGWRQQLQSIKFLEVEDVPATYEES